MVVKWIFANSVGESRGRCVFSPGMSCDPPGWSCHVPGMLNEALRCRLKTEVHRSSGLENRAETSGFNHADFLSGTGISTEPVVLTRAPDFISA
ncbi:hypothetical protein Enr17x_18480 [Gimesia fumaroli]|uniref:Uncharacterized protein n=1 Tax=Gimesia fumaroli TaxID=2527976 RepID=A0A518I9P9_9PLAN|nr:hypothetical protein Enr17x_18480 [Gimesia fumaroli]